MKRSTIRKTLHLAAHKGGFEVQCYSEGICPYPTAEIKQELLDFFNYCYWKDNSFMTERRIGIFPKHRLGI